jgi:hypothetical protein
MKERLVEDWLTRINERGYELPFCQTLLSKGFKIIRCGHSPTEHGKDILALSPDGTVCAYQLKTGDFGQADVGKHHAQINMLVETRPIHAGLPNSFEYRPFFVTTGEFKDPAVSLITELNAGWKHRNLPTLTLINGRQLVADFVTLSSDFWPVSSPETRRFRELYLTDGRSDLDLSKFAKFLSELLQNTKSGLDLERRAAAANLFSSYLLGEFYKHEDHWSIVQGWTVCAAQIAWAGLSGKHDNKHWIDACQIAKEGALTALKLLAKEVLSENAFQVKDRELNDYTRTRNTIALAAACCWQLISNRDATHRDEFQKTLELLLNYLERGRLLFWGEGALSQYLIFVWVLERSGNHIPAYALLLGIISAVAERNAKNSETPYEDPYASPDDCLLKLFGKIGSVPSIRRQAVESYSLFPLIIFAVRRNLRQELEQMWRQITDVSITWFRAEAPEDALLWRCEKGKEYSQTFAHPQSWEELKKFVTLDDRDRIPKVLQDDVELALLYILVFQHRTPLSLMKSLDNALHVELPS